MFVDPEFGEVIIRKNARSRSVSFSIATSGRLQATVPSFVSERSVKKTLKRMRDQIRQKLNVKDPSTQRARDTKKKLLMKQAKEYLPYRLEYFAKLYGYHYDKVVMSHASSPSLRLPQLQFHLILVLCKYLKHNETTSLSTSSLTLIIQIILKHFGQKSHLTTPITVHIENSLILIHQGSSV